MHQGLSKEDVKNQSFKKNEKAKEEVFNYDWLNEQD